MKKNFIKILTVILVAAFVPISYAAEEPDPALDIRNEESYIALDGLGLLDENIKAKAEINDVITRAEYAQILYNIITFNEEKTETESWKDEFFGEFNIEETAEVSGEATVFTDVDTSMEGGSAILYVCARGIMHGKGNGIFDPDAQISYMEAAKPIVGMLGYSQYANVSGGYWEGIQAVLNNLDLYKPSRQETMTVLDVCNLVWSAFDENVMIFKFENGNVTYEESEQTFMNKWMEIDKCKGVVYDNGITSLSGESTVGHGKIQVGDMVLKANSDFTDMIGREVYAYYSYSDEKENEMFYIKETSKNTVTVIAAEDIEKYNDYTIEYFKGNSHKRLKLQDNAYMIYNGKSKDSWNSEDFKITDGSVTVIDNGNDNVVIIEDYMNVVISFYNGEEGKIYNRAKDNIDKNGDEVIDIKEAVEEENAYIYWATGEKAATDNIKAGLAADIIKNGDYVKIILNTEIMADVKVTSIDTKSDDDRYFEVSSPNGIYKIFKRYKKAQDAVNISMNNSYTFYMNRNGAVVWVEGDYAPNGSAAYVIKTYIDEENDGLKAKILNENGKVFTVSCAEKVKYTDSEGNVLKLDANALYVRLRDYNGIFIYKTNERDEVTAIEMPRKDKTDDNVLQTLEYNQSATLAYTNDGTYGTFRHELFVSDNTKIFSVPSSEGAKGDDSNYKVGTRSTMLKGNTNYEPFKAYSSNAETRVASYLVMENAGKDEFECTSASLQFMVVNEITQGINNDNEACTNVSGWILGYNVKTNDYITKYAVADKTDKNGNEVTALEIATDLLNSYDKNGNTNTYKVQKGDIIRFLTDETGEKITTVQILYGINRDNPAFPNGRKGWLVGTSGKYDSEDAYSNPFAITNYGTSAGKVSKISEANKRMSGGTRFYAGFVYDCVDGIAELTANDLSVNSYSADSLAYFPEYRILKTSTVINCQNKNLSVSSGGEEALKTYKDAGNECSQMITADFDNNFRFYIIINRE